MIYTTKAVRSVSKQGHIQPHFHSKARSLSRTVKWRILKQIYYTIVTAKDKQYFRAACLDNNTSLNLFSIQFDIKSLLIKRKQMYHTCTSYFYSKFNLCQHAE